MKLPLSLKKFLPKRNSEKPEHSADASVQRRTFLERLGTGSVLLALTGFGFQSLRSLVPNVSYEPLLRFKIGTPPDIPDGVTFLEDKRLYIFKQGNSFHAISGACTHLGCTVKYTKLNAPKTVEIHGEKKTIAAEFHCPCHGSKFYEDGTNFAGPAPRPLKWHKVEISPDDGQLVVDMNGEVDQQYRLTV